MAIRDDIIEDICFFLPDPLAAERGAKTLPEIAEHLQNKGHDVSWNDVIDTLRDGEDIKAVERTVDGWRLSSTGPLADMTLMLARLQVQALLDRDAREECYED